jgi:ArsR family metal-binding transcriptional regulator
VAGCCECGDEPSDSCATELVSAKTGIRRCIPIRIKTSVSQIRSAVMLSGKIIVSLFVLS